MCIRDRTTSNQIDRVPGPLRDRMEMLDFTGYIVEEKIEIAKRHLIPKQVKDHALKNSEIKFRDSGIKLLVESYTKEAGLRNLERQVANVCRKVATEIASGNKKNASISSKNVEQYIGPKRFLPEIAERNTKPGIVVGLAWTAFGGDILFIEATKKPGKGNLKLTGKLGDVMQESIKAAITVVKTRSVDLAIDLDEFDKKDILKRVVKIVKANSKQDSQPGIVISDTYLPEGLYWQGVRSIVVQEDLDPILSSCVTFGMRGSRGLIGAACALAWSGYHSKVGELNFTWELIAYREKSMWGTLRDISSESVSKVSELKDVFSCNDQDGKVAMVPNSPCPVLWGFRGTNDKILIDNFHKLGPEKPSRWLLYQTNQATDDHFCISDILELTAFTSVWVDVSVSSKAEIIKGGHRFFRVKDSEENEVKCAVFEPSKSLRAVVDKLEVGDEICLLYTSDAADE